MAHSRLHPHRLQTLPSAPGIVCCTHVAGLALGAAQAAMQAVGCMARMVRRHTQALEPPRAVDAAAGSEWPKLRQVQVKKQIAFVFVELETPNYVPRCPREQ